MSGTLSKRLLPPFLAIGLLTWLPAGGDSAPADTPVATDSGTETQKDITDTVSQAVEDAADAVADAAAEAVDAVVEAVAPATPVADINADHWGFGAMLPANTQIVLALENLSTHLDGLLESVFWQRASILFEEAMAMAPGEDMPDIMGTIRRYGGQSAVVAFGDGWQQWLELFIKVDAADTRYTIKAALTGTDPTDALISYTNPAVMAELAAMSDQLRDLEIPTITLAVKPTEPETVMESLWTEEAKAELDERIVVGELDLNGHSLVLLTAAMDQFMTEEMRADLLDGMEGDDLENASEVLDMLTAKKIEVAFGMAGDHLVVFIGGDHSQFQIAAAGESILTNPTVARLAPWQDKLRVVWGYVSADLMRSVSSEQPLLPVLDGLIDGLNEHETFSFVGEAIAPFRDRLAAKEKDVFAYEYTDTASVVWWDGGFHGEDFGGAIPRAYTGGVPLKFLGIASRPSNIVGLAFNGDPEYSALIRSYFELWGGALYAAVQEAVRSGLLGEDAGQQFALFEDQVLPRLLEIYEGQRMLFQEGLGSQYGFVLDLQGRGPTNPMKELIPLDFDNLTFMRFASMYDVVDREKVAEGWKSIGPVINRIVRDNPFMASPIMLNPLSMNEGDMKIWFYPTPVFNDEFLLSSAVNDEVMVIGTSRGLAADIRDNSKPADDDPTAFYLRLDLQPVVVATENWEEMALELEMGDPETIKDGFLVFREWLSPFQEITYRHWQDESGWRGSWSFKLQDMVAFD